MSAPDTDDRAAGARESQTPAAASTRRDALEGYEPFEVGALVGDLAEWRKEASRRVWVRFRTGDAKSTALLDALQVAQESCTALNGLLRPGAGFPARDAANARRTAGRREIEAAVEDYAAAVATVTEALRAARRGILSKLRLRSSQRAAALEKQLTRVGNQLQAVRKSLQTAPGPGERASAGARAPDDLTELIEHNNRLLDQLRREPQAGEPLRAWERDLETQARKMAAGANGFAPVPTLPDGNWSRHGPLGNIIGHLEGYRQNREVWFARVGADWDAETSFEKVPSVANFETLRDGRDVAAQANEACQHAYAAVKAEFAAVSRDFPNDPEVGRFSEALAAANKEFDAIRNRARYHPNPGLVPSQERRPQRTVNSQRPPSAPVADATNSPAATAHRHGRG